MPMQLQVLMFQKICIIYVIYVFRNMNFSHENIPHVKFSHRLCKYVNLPFINSFIFMHDQIFLIFSEKGNLNRFISCEITNTYIHGFAWHINIDICALLTNIIFFLTKHILNLIHLLSIHYAVYACTFLAEMPQRRAPEIETKSAKRL